MNAPFTPVCEGMREARLDEPDERDRIEAFVAEQGGTVFHRPAWLLAVEEGTGQAATGLIAERGDIITGWLPLTDMRSPIFGCALVSSGFGMEGGILATTNAAAERLASCAEELAGRRACTELEVRGGPLPENWQRIEGKHAIFARDLAENDEAQMLAVPRKQRAEIRKGLNSDLTVRLGCDQTNRAAHYIVYATSVRNLGTPVFPRRLFDAVLDRLDADILTIEADGMPVASVLSIYHAGTVMPYWGGGLPAARGLRANDRMYFELMRHARERGCHRFDFGRSKIGSGPFAFKKNWGFEPRPLAYAKWIAPGCQVRSTDPTSDSNAAKIALWQKLPLGLANRIGPFIARGLG